MRCGRERRSGRSRLVSGLKPARGGWYQRVFASRGTGEGDTRVGWCLCVCRSLLVAQLASSQLGRLPGSWRHDPRQDADKIPALLGTVLSLLAGVASEAFLLAASFCFCKRGVCVTDLGSKAQTPHSCLPTAVLCIGECGAGFCVKPPSTLPYCNFISYKVRASTNPQEWEQIAFDSLICTTGRQIRICRTVVHTRDEI